MYNNWPAQVFLRRAALMELADGTVRWDALAVAEVQGWCCPPAKPSCTFTCTGITAHVTAPLPWYLSVPPGFKILTGKKKIK